MTIHVSQDIISTVTHPITGERALVHRFTFVNDVTHMHVQVISYGAAIFSLRVPDENGIQKDVVMGFDYIQDYVSPRNPYFGATIGRICNRLAYGSFFIQGKEYLISQNHGINHLHGGYIGFDKIPWDLKEIHDNGVTFCHRSPDGHEGYPGELFATVRFSIHEDNSLRIYMTAKTTKPTMVNMTNHSYFNLAGHNAGKEALYQHIVSIFSREITKTNEYCIPTGELQNVLNTAYDLRCGDSLGRRIRQIADKKLGYDDYFCAIRDGLGPKDLARVAKVIHPPSGRWMEVYTNQLGVQFYTANFLPDQRKGERPLKGRNNATYYKHGAFCMETHGYPDASSHIHFPPILLRPGELYEHWVNYKFGTMNKEAPITRLSELDDIEYIDASIDEESLEDEVYVAAGDEDVIMEEEKPQSSGAIKKQERKETGAIKKEIPAVAAVKSQVKPFEKPKAEIKGKITVEVTIEREPKEELSKEAKKYKTDTERGAFAATAPSTSAAARAGFAQGIRETEDFEELQGACGGEPKQ